uniref:Ig-like domain-containing protein n=1 Tax=Cyprinus carpio TaxID=7962 RepID=A0A8C2IID6_CYPCA
MKKCALKGSTIHLSGTYKHPSDVTVTEKFWTVNPSKGNSIQTNITLTDSTLVEIPAEIMEGESPVLFCKTTCDLSGKTNFTWYKNGKRLSERIISEQLLLPSVSSDDTGNYSCAVRDQKHLSSPAVTLSVRYPPKNVSVSISPSGVTVEGDSVTLSCSSDSNPPALIFSWFKENQSSAVGSGQSFSISSFNSSHSGRFYCEAQNKHGSQRSESVSLISAAAGICAKSAVIFALEKPENTINHYKCGLCDLCAIIQAIQLTHSSRRKLSFFILHLKYHS